MEKISVNNWSGWPIFNAHNKLSAKDRVTKFMTETDCGSFVFMPTLKERTLGAHRRLEQAMNLRWRLGSKDRYQRLLELLLAFYLPIENMLQEISSLEKFVPALNRRWKSGLLRQDLGHLDPETRTLAVAQAPDLPTVNNLGSALGCLYVMEGSTLGGQIICRMIERSLGFSTHTGAAFFGGYGRETMTMWNSFKHSLERAAINDGFSEPILSSADQMFRSLDRWLSRI
jgi:heme oxygenase